MKELEVAKAFDLADRPVQAINQYEQAIGRSTQSLEVYLDLAVLYLNCTDFGFAAFHKIPVELERTSYAKALEILDAAEKKCGAHSEILFWRLYLPFKALGEELSPEVIAKIANKNESLIPFFYLYVSSGKKLFLHEAQELANLVSQGLTTRQRFVMGFLRPFNKSKIKIMEGNT